MSAREMERCECQVGHAGPLMALVDVRCAARCRVLRRDVGCKCCIAGTHLIPYVAVAGCFRKRFQHTACGGQALLVLEPVASSTGVEG